MRRSRAERRATARQHVASPGWLGPVGLACLCLVTAARAADEPSGQRLNVIEPRVAVSETITDNFDVGSLHPESDAITKLTAGLGWRARTGALRGFFDYALTSVVYARHSDRNEVQNALSANLVADLIDKRLQVVTAANISRNAISAFGVQPGSGSDANANLTETRTLQITPTLHGPLGSALVYSATVGYALTNAASAAAGDSSSTTATLHMEPSSRARLGWSLDATHLGSSYTQGRRTQSDRLFGGLSLNLDEQDLQLSATGGTERTNLLSLESTQHSTWGVGAKWVPSPFTQVSAEVEERFFGRSHALSIEHRTARTIFRLRSARSLSTSGSEVPGVRSPAFDLFFGQPSLVAQLPDLAQREAYVNALLRRLNIDPSRVIDTGFLRSAATVDDLLSLSAAWTGPRDAAVLMISRGKTRRVDTLSTAIDDLSRRGEVRTSSLSLDLSHRLTPMSTLNLLLAVQQARNGQSGQVDQSNSQTQAELQYTTRLTSDSTLSGSLRRAHYKAGLLSHDETAITANLGVRF